MVLNVFLKCKAGIFANQVATDKPCLTQLDFYEFSMGIDSFEPSISCWTEWLLWVLQSGRCSFLKRVISAGKFTLLAASCTQTIDSPSIVPFASFCHVQCGSHARNSFGEAKPLQSARFPSSSTVGSQQKRYAAQKHDASDTSSTSRFGTRPFLMVQGKVKGNWGTFLNKFWLKSIQFLQNYPKFEPIFLEKNTLRWQ